MTVSWAMFVSTRCVLWDAERTQTVQSPTHVSITDVLTHVLQPVDLMPSARLSTIEPNVPVHLDTFPTQVQLWLVSSSLRFVATMLSVQTDRCVMENSAKMSASMIRLVETMKSVTMVFVRPCVELMMIVTARRSVEE